MARISWCDGRSSGRARPVADGRAVRPRGAAGAGAGARTAEMGRSRRRRRAQRPDRRRLSRARRTLRPRARTPGAAGRSVHSRPPVSRSPVRDEPVRVPRRPPPSPRHRRTRLGPLRIPHLRLRTRPVDTVRGRHVADRMVRRRAYGPCGCRDLTARCRRFPSLRHIVRASARPSAHRCPRYLGRRSARPR